MVHKEAAPTSLHHTPHLLEQARSLWQFGHWASLAKWDLGEIREHRGRAELALLVGASQLQIGDVVRARAYLQAALQWGTTTTQMGKILVPGVYYTLGRAAAALNAPHKVQQYFQNAVATGASKNDSAPLTQSRNRNQDGKPVPPSITEAAAPRFRVKNLAMHNLGDAWAGNTINTVIFRHHGILTHDDTQYTAFYVDTHTLRLVQRDLVTDTLKTFDLPGEYNLRDAHNSISMGIDRHGHLHISYDHHATQLRYRRSINPGDIGAWTQELPMTGAHEEKVTYPTFILPHHGYPLTLLYRDGVHNKGTARLKTYDEATQAWVDHPQPILSGAELKPWTSNAYWNHPAIGSDGSLHLSFVWRTDSIGEQHLVNNVNICYAWSPDNGLSWFTSRGQPCKLPMTQVNAETVWAVSPGSNLINQTSMALDSHNRPHIVFYANDTHGVPQYQHIWFDGEAWLQQYFSARTQPFSLQGKGTLQIPMSRPEILIDKQDRVYAVYRGDLSDNHMAVTQLMRATAGQETADASTHTTRLWHKPLDYAEPVIDRARWSNCQVLSLLLQRTQQPNGDLSPQHTNDPVWLVDFSLS